ncbi:unnamed protein product [Allacma fusca]|uniref:Uncharacterized protein n=1 Tax=Allacma fusca TaxID=39272 RepID=A0A8J2JQ33_9HEXA|nr:unnamed protein product [Allacma fusca]
MTEVPEELPVDSSRLYPSVAPSGHLSEQNLIFQYLELGLGPCLRMGIVLAILLAFGDRVSNVVDDIFVVSTEDHLG